MPNSESLSSGNNTAPPPSTLGRRIRARREAVGLTQEKLAAKCGVSRAAVAQWEAGVTRPSLDNLVKAAEALSVWLSWLTVGDQSLPDGPNPFAGGTARQPLLPVVDYSRAGDWDATAPPTSPAPDAAIATDLVLSACAFALVIADDSMAPEFRDGDKIIIDPDVPPQPGDLIIAKLDRDEQATFRKYRPRAEGDGPTTFELVPLNPDWPAITVGADNPGRIIGTLVEHRRYRRRPG